MSPRPRACVLGLQGLELTADEAGFFADVNPLGFILFARNVASPIQLEQLTSDLRMCLNRPDTPILIDQEGGRVARLKPPHWHKLPAAAEIAALPLAQAQEAAWLTGRLIAYDCARAGINVVCAPCLDVLAPGVATEVIGDRSYGPDAGLVATLGRAMADGLIAGGTLPVAKHIPGHGRALVDSHYALPTIETSIHSLAAVDFAPFHALRDLPFAMTAHIDYTCIDPRVPATCSPIVIRDIIRGQIGFDGFLLSDDLSMAALGGPIGARAERSLAAGCDAVLHCNSRMEEMQAVAASTPALDHSAFARWSRISHPIAKPFDAKAGAASLSRLMAVS